MSIAREVEYEHKSNRIMKQARPYLKPSKSSGIIASFPRPWQREWLSNPVFCPILQFFLPFLSVFVLCLDFSGCSLLGIAWLLAMAMAAMVGLTPLPGSNYRGRGNMSKLSLIGDDISIIPLKLLFSAKSPASA